MALSIKTYKDYCTNEDRTFLLTIPSAGLSWRECFELLRHCVVLAVRRGRA